MLAIRFADEAYPLLLTDGAVDCKLGASGSRCVGPGRSSRPSRESVFENIRIG